MRAPIVTATFPTSSQIASSILETCGNSVSDAAISLKQLANASVGPVQGSSRAGKRRLETDEDDDDENGSDLIVSFPVGFPSQEASLHTWPPLVPLVVVQRSGSNEATIRWYRSTLTSLGSNGLRDW